MSPRRDANQPARVWAIVVGIESYSWGPRLNLPGPAYDAVRMVNWLRSDGVPEDQMTVLLSPLPEHEQDIREQLGLDYQPADWTRLRAEILKPRDADVLFVYLAGHGLQQERDPFLLAADATADTPLMWNLAAMAFYLAGHGPPAQLILVDACRDVIPLDGPAFDHDYRSRTSVERNPEQYLIHASSAGGKTGNDKQRRDGVFTRQALRALHTLGRATDRWAHLASVFAELKESLLATQEYEPQQDPEFWQIDGGRVLPPFRPRALVGTDDGAPVATQSPYLFRVRTDHGEPPGCVRLDQQHLVSLDILWACDRRLRTAVLADGLNRRLARQLNAVEQGVLVPALGPLPRRRWVDIELSEPELPTESALRAAFGPDDGVTGTATVLRCFTSSTADQVTALIHLLGRLGLSDQTRPVLVQVCAARTVDAVRAATAVARHLGLPEIAVRPADPGLSPERPLRDDQGDLARTGATEALAAVRALVPTQWLDRLVPEGGPAPDPVSPAAALDPEAVVRDLNQGGAWGEAATESRILRAVRVFRPDLYWELLPALARARTHPQRYLALEVAADSDDEIDRWLAVATSDPVTPGGTVPGHTVRPEVAAALALGLIRNNRPPEEVAGWARLADPVTRRVCDHHCDQAARADQDRDHDRDESDARFLALADVATATAAVRAGIGAGLALADIPGSARSASCWRVLARRTLDSATASWLAGMPDELRRIVGLSTSSMNDDVQFVEDASDLREALLPSLPHRTEEHAC